MGSSQPGRRVAGEILDQPGDRSPRPLTNGTGAFRIGRTELLQPLLETGCIQLMDSENPHATWRATELQTSQSPLRRAVSASAVSRIFTNLVSPKGSMGFFQQRKG